ncbi:MAG: amidohydrolase family protein [Capsulimonadaceae bacterium]|nr:amidohydrolase family protein [Capsulimonadaceae bacterium]
MEIIDCDVHPLESPEHPLQPFVPNDIREAVKQGMASMPGAGYANPFGVIRRDATCVDPVAAGRDYLDPYNVRFAVLQPQGIYAGLTHNIDVANGMARAWNDWQTATFLDADPRFLGSISVNMNDPKAAAREIRRVGSHKQLVQVLVTGESTHLYGHRAYDEVYEACCEMGLVFALHPGAEGARTPSTPVGMPSSYFEWHTTLPLTFQAHCVSLIAEGTFERFPSLNVLLVEGGIGWLPSLLWRMDKNFKALRSTVPWLRRLPSEYALEHIRLTTQPIEEPPDSEKLLQLFGMLHAETILCYSSDYPHWDFDDPRKALPSRMPSDLAQRIFYDNAADLYGLPPANREGRISEEAK